MLRKVYVSVECKFSADEGQPVIPLSFTWEDGRIFETKCSGNDIRKAASQAVGGAGYRYECNVMNKKVHLYLEGSRWFLEGKR